ncbi:MAG: TIGR00341 family protein [Chloroflexota bacterium]
MSEAKRPQPQYFHRILVPIARPDTAAQLLELATALSDPDDGVIIALTVGLDNEGEKTQERIESLQPIVDEFEDVELVTQIASSITRGILDGAREHRAEALIMGVHRSDRREVELGAVVENIVQAAPCNVLVFRTGERNDFSRVVVPLGDYTITGMALQVGVVLASKTDTPINTPIIQRDYTSTREKEKFITDTLEALPYDHVEKKEFIQGRSPGETLLTQLSEYDMLVLGFSQKGELELEFGRDMTDTLLRRAKGPVLLYSQILEERDSMTGIVQRFAQRFNPALTQVERNELVWTARKSALSSIDFNWLIIMSAGLASLGLMLNSVAVIIGAMLVAPLMSPLGSLAIGLAVGELDMTRRAALTLIQGTFLAILISIAFGLLLPQSAPTQEMLSRGTPTLLDAAVALVSGFVAAFALARKEIPVALAGVAIAAALMPPICTIGLGIAFGDMRLATGATLLFVTNITFIVASENLIFLWMGMRPGRRQETQRGVALWWGLISAILIVVITGIVRLGIDATDDIEIGDFLLEQLNGAEFVSIEERVREDDTLSVLLTVRSPDDITAEQVSALEQLLEDTPEIEREVALDIINIRVVEARNAFQDDVVRVLEDQFNTGRITDAIFLDDTETGIITIDAVLQTADTISLEDVAEAEAILETQFAPQAFALSLVIETVFNVPQPEITPEVTEEAPANEDE